MVFETPPTPENIQDTAARILRHPPDASMYEESAGLQIMDLRLLFRL